MTFSELSEAQKTGFATQVQNAQASVGGANFFLTILEQVKSSRPAALVEKECSFHYGQGTISWNKAVYQDRYNYLRTVIKERRFESSFVPDPKAKGYKNILNLVRMLKPLHFQVEPKDKDLGAGFEFDAFDVDAEGNTTLNWLFLAIFFLPVEFTKQALAHTL